MNTRRAGSIAILPVLATVLAGCACLAIRFGEPATKYCGRDFGDRIHWQSVPSWFKPSDCKGLNGDAITSDLFLGCYSHGGGFQQGAPGLALFAQSRCDW